MSKNYFYHGGMLLSEDELMHWKYISKKRVNGKWVYVYDDKKVNDVKKEREKLHKKSSDLIMENRELNRELGSYEVTLPSPEKADAWYTPEELAELEAEYQRQEKIRSKRKENSTKQYEFSRQASELGKEITTAKWEKIYANGMNVVYNVLSKFKKKK